MMMDGLTGACRLQVFPGALTRGSLLPPKLSFEVSNLCNVYCVMCDVAQRIKETGVRPKTRMLTAAMVLDRLADFRRLRAAILSGGHSEPFLNRELAGIIGILKQRGAQVQVLTNGTVMAERVMEPVILAGLDWVVVSLHGATAATAQGIMEGARFERVVENVRSLDALKKKLGSDVPKVGFTFVGMRRNIRELAEFVELAARLGARSVTLKSMMERQAEGLHALKGQCLAMDAALLKEEYSRAEEAARRHGVRLSANDPYASIIAGRGPGGMPGATGLSLGKGMTRFCMFPFEKPFIDIEGKVKLCCSETGRHVEMGDTDKGGFRAVWEGRAYGALRQALLSGRGLPDCCVRCERAPVVEPMAMQMHVALGQYDHEERLGTGVFIGWNNGRYDEYVRGMGAFGVKPSPLKPGSLYEALAAHLRVRHPLAHAGLGGLKRGLKRLL